MEAKDRGELLKSVYEQNWLHARHVENERLWFTNIYVIAVGGLLAYTFGRSGSAFWPWPILILVFIFSMAGFLMCHSMRIPFLFHSRIADIIQIKEWHLPYHYFYSRCPKSYKLANPGAKYFPVSAGKGPSKVWSFSDVFQLLYGTMASFSVAFLAYDLGCRYRTWYEWWVALAAGLVWCVILFVYKKVRFEKREKEVGDYLQKLLGKDKE
ncbi:hypothetical protein ES702_04902 [subsurface metagenome]